MEKSFTAITREELSKLKFTKDVQLLAELSAFAFSTGNIKLGRGSMSLELSTEFEGVILRMVAIIKRLYSGQPEIRVLEKSQPKKHKVYSVELAPTTAEGQLLFEIGLLEGVGEDYSFGSINKKVFEPEGCQEAALRGAFLGCGVLCDPNKGYRLEFVLSHDEFAEFLCSVLEEKGIQAHLMHRKERNVIYLNQIENISDILILTGAASTMMRLESISVDKDVKNNINRGNNCMVANIGKAVDAAERQTQDIIVLTNAGVKLSKSLKEAAELRLNNPGVSLSELSEISGTVSKSALNKRFIKIRQLREELKL